MVTQKLVHSEICTQEGTEYEIRIVSEREGFLWRWTCQQCGDIVATDTVGADVKASVRSAEKSLLAHHSSKHRNGRAPRV